ncbi:hypothetical protein [Priestia megaterium]|uniref:hypothetical protein n=1 Tax=Priestia megaterium TaxID=1404 RepID=UPI003CC53733
MKCEECKYWIEADGYERKQNVGGCYYFKPTYFPMFLSEDCGLKEPYKSKVEFEHKELD